MKEDRDSTPSLQDRSNIMRLRAFEPEDAEMAALCDNHQEDWWTGDLTAPYSLRMLREYAENYGADPLSEGQLRLIAENDEGDFIGIADFYEINARHSRAFAGLCISPEHRGKGYGKKLLQLMIDYNSDILGMDTLAARIAVDNSVSEHIFSESGFRQAGILPGWHHNGRRKYDIGIWVLTPHGRKA